LPAAITRVESAEEFFGNECALSQRFAALRVLIYNERAAGSKRLCLVRVVANDRAGSEKKERERERERERGEKQVEFNDTMAPMEAETFPPVCTKCQDDSRDFTGKTHVNYPVNKTERLREGKLIFA